MSARSNKQRQRSRRVSFHGKVRPPQQPPRGTGRELTVPMPSQTSVFEFERQLFGGGGVPDDDSVSLGLGPRLVGTYEGPLHEKEAKDEYGCTGSLEESARAQLLAEFSSQSAVKRELSRT